MEDKSKLIMETITLVRSRKARPDLERICKTMLRNHGVDPKDTEKWLDDLCGKGVVARRPFKGAVSYRIVADEKIGAIKATARYYRNLRKIKKAISALDSHGLGVSFNAIERYVSSNWPLTCSILSLRVRLRSSLRDGVEEGRFIKTKGGCYKVGQPPSGVEEVNEDEAMDDTNDESGDDLLCDYCQQNADKNPLGEPEELLICKDCGNKAHPSCLNYSPELVEQIRADDSWQCIDCKACTICDGTGDPDSLLFCDACDKGYHMNCHTPKLDQMPSGKWMCNTCAVKRVQSSNDGVFIIDEENNIIKSVGNGTVSSIAPVSLNNGPPTMVQLQRTTNNSIATPTLPTTPQRQKVDSIAPRPSSSQFRQPMIALGSPTTVHFPPAVLQPAQASPGIVRGQPTQLNTSSYAMPPPSHAVIAKPHPQVIPQNFQITPNRYQQVPSYLREDVLRSLPPDVADWSVADVCYYIKSHGFPGESKLFEDQEVDGKALLLMSRNDVLTGLRLKLGPALKIFHLHISRLQSRTKFIGI